MGKNLFYLLESLRPKQWIKNLFIFAGILFSQNLLNLRLLTKTIEAFLIFCILSGAVYIVNDIVDREKDKLHPYKSKRPIASGKLKVSSALMAVSLFVPLALILAFFLNRNFFLVSIGYFLLQVGYSFVFKNIVILDVFAVALGFVLRVAAGTIVIEVSISSWLLVCTILLALFLGLSKRRHELVVLGDAEGHRAVLREYSPYLLDQMISVVTASTVIAYTLYTMSGETIRKFGTKNLIFTVPFVLYGVFRYLYLIHQKGAGGSPEILIVTDKPLIIDILLWIITVFIIIYRS
jgi:4-hydroxybenzoate polyprenyltransferase